MKEKCFWIILVRYANKIHRFHHWGVAAQI